jgi:hypothetical protein
LFSVFFILQYAGHNKPSGLFPRIQGCYKLNGFPPFFTGNKKTMGEREQVIFAFEEYSLAVVAAIIKMIKLSG